eukprot:CAMPEP_0185268238 /NCGR_PEP_ID=MMETSP1359-20130426/36572_1 /TAXON_ID=552665 /ORGANISM="Bigelowiella longifila, Strain CCMP242" /LENGTH=46 /DNA_ID= /DNA_START= /DNA_END= /DNA_ORIENTATION=
MRNCDSAAWVRSQLASTVLEQHNARMRADAVANEAHSSSHTLGWKS